MEICGYSKLQGRTPAERQQGPPGSCVEGLLLKDSQWIAGIAGRLQGRAPAVRVENLA